MKFFVAFLSLLLAGHVSAQSLQSPSAVAGQFFQISDRWTQKELVNNSGSDWLGYVEAGIQNTASHWTTEPVTGEWFRIKNRQNGQYIHIEPVDGVVRLGNVPGGFWSSHWRFRNLGSFFVIENRWISSDRVHVENQDGIVRHAALGDNFWSAQWILASVESLNSTPNVHGQWSGVIDWPLVAIHSGLTADGKVLTYGTDQQGRQGGQFVYDLWNPELGFSADSHLTLPNAVGTDLFCSAQILVPGTDDMLLAGGDIRGLNLGGVNRGVADANLFNATSNTLNATVAMNFARWYPTLTTLPNGEILVQGGIDENGVPVTVPEIYNSQSRSWRRLDGASNNVNWWYPRNWVAPNGSVFGLSGNDMYRINTSGAGSYARLGGTTGSNNGYTSTAVMFRPGRILQIGGGVPAASNPVVNASAQVSEYDIRGSDPVVTERPGMQYPRHWSTSTVLPDGNVLVTGGSAAANYLKGVARAAEIYNPQSQRWLTAASAREERLYHSTAILLPDASVLVAGGGAPAAFDAAGNATPPNLNAEIYYPPYYFDANNNRRTLSNLVSAPDRIAVGQSFSITPVDSSSIQQVNLIKTGSVTHSFNMEQRFVPLSFTNQGGQLRVNAPANLNIAPPGFYMLFTVDNNGVPSKAEIISIVANENEYEADQWFQLSDRWTSKELYVDANSGVVRYSEIPVGQRSSHWTEEELGYGGWVRLRNRVTGGYMHIEPRTGQVAVGDIGVNAWSSHWGKQSVDGGFTIFNNHWIVSDKIHVENQGSIAQHGSVPNSFWSAQWKRTQVQ